MKNLLFIIVTVIIPIFSYADGGEKGDAAQVIFCNGNIENKRFPKPGYYLLDYVHEDFKDTEWHEESGSLDAKSMKGNLNKIFDILKNNLFEYYSAYIFNTHENITRRAFYLDKNNKWYPTKAKLKLTEVPSFFELPPNDSPSFGICLKETITQAVTFKNGKYYYNEDIVNSIKEMGKLQYSMLIMHEFLRQVQLSTDIIFKLNNIFHSKDYHNPKKRDTIAELFHQKGLISPEELEGVKYQISINNKDKNEYFELREKLISNITTGYKLALHELAFLDVVEDNERCGIATEAKRIMDEVNNKHLFAAREKMNVLFYYTGYDRLYETNIDLALKSFSYEYEKIKESQNIECKINNLNF